MPLRPRDQILSDIAKHEAHIKGFYDELEAIQLYCPHPNVFLSVTQKDVWDDADGPATYECTYLTVDCSLCGKHRVQKYDKSERDYTSEDVIQKS